MHKIMAVRSGAVTGSISRYLLFLAPRRVTGTAFPVGRVRGLLGEARLTNAWRSFIFTGFPGGFTTFSAFTPETTQLLTSGEWRATLPQPGISRSLDQLLVFPGYHAASGYRLTY